MLSVINKREALSKLLKDLEHVVEVYAHVDFNMEWEMPNLYFLCTHKIDTVTAFYKLHEIFDYQVKLYVTLDPYAAILQGQRIIWREGKWFV